MQGRDRFKTCPYDKGTEIPMFLVGANSCWRPGTGYLLGFAPQPNLI